jgi:hypothetical protein
VDKLSTNINYVSLILFLGWFFKQLGFKPRQNARTIFNLETRKPIELTEEKIIVGCESPGAKIYLDQRKLEIEGEIKKYLKKNLNIEFILQASQKKHVEAPLLSFEPAPEDLFSRAGLESK